MGPPNKIDIKQTSTELEELHNQKGQTGLLLAFTGAVSLFIYPSALNDATVPQSFSALSSSDPIPLAVAIVLAGIPIATISSLIAAVAHEKDSLSLGDRVEMVSVILVIPLALLVSIGVWPTDTGMILSTELNRFHVLVVIAQTQLLISTSRSLLREVIHPLPAAHE